MKKNALKVLIIFLAPLLMSTQCEDDFENSGFETSFFLENLTNTNLFYLNDRGAFTNLTSGTNIIINSDLNLETSPISPSESLNFDFIQLFRMEGGDFILVYEQDPIDDDLWEFNEPSVNRFEYVLTITEDLIN